MLAANVPPAVHAGIAPRLAPAVELLVASGIRPPDAAAVSAAYAQAGMRRREEREDCGWLALVLERDDG